MDISNYKILIILIIILCVFASILISFFPSIRGLFSFGYSNSSQEFPILTSSEVIIFFPDFPMFWEKLSYHPIGMSAYDNLYAYLYNVELSFRKRLGIRLTPVRWSFWLGNGCVFCLFGGEYWAVITKPPVYSRLLIPFLVKTRLESNKSGKLYLFKENNYLIFSNYANCQNQLQYLNFPTRTEEDCVIHTTASNKTIELHLNLRDNIEIIGSILGYTEVNNISEKPTFPNVAVTASGDFLKFIDELVSKYVSKLVSKETLEYIEFPIELYLRTIKGSPVGDVVLRLIELVKTRDGVLVFTGGASDYSVPIPAICGWFPGEEKEISPILQLLGLPEYIPAYSGKWDTLEGFVVPLWDRAYQLCLARTKDGILFSTNESVMSRIAPSLISDAKNSPLIFINFASMAKHFGMLYHWAVSLDLKYFLNLKDFSELYPPWENFFQALGKMELYTTNDAQSNRIFIRGKIGK